MLNLVHVRAFLEVVESGGFGEASRRLALAQPTVSQQVRKLEESLGAALLVRGRQACRPTREGEAFLPYARSLLAVARRAREAVAPKALSLGASSNVGIYLLQPSLQDFRAGPGRDLEVDLWIGRNPALADKLESREVDLGVMEWWDGRPGFQALPWRREPLVVILPPGHPWAGLAAIAREQLFGLPLIGGEPGSGTGRALRDALGDDVERLSMGLQLGSTEAVKHAVKAGLGLSVVLAGSVADEVRLGTLVALPIEGLELAKELFVVCPDDLPKASPAARFRAFLAEQAPA